MRKRKRNRWMNDVTREQCARLAQVGLGSHYIAQRVFGVPAGDMAYQSRLCRGAIRSALYAMGIHITDWSKGKTSHSRQLGEQALRGTTKRHRKAG